MSGIKEAAGVVEGLEGVFLLLPLNPFLRLSHCDRVYVLCSAAVSARGPGWQLLQPEASKVWLVSRRDRVRPPRRGDALRG